jgi:tagatose 1,6-diphosphate aldolase
MDMLEDVASLPDPPDGLANGDVRLEFVRLVPGDPERGYVPSYHFRIVTRDGIDVGHINFRVGDNEHITLFAGHIGYSVDERRRGHGYARQACLALAPFIRTIYESVLITCDPDNWASMRTIERIGAEFINEQPVPLRDRERHQGSHTKKRYRWTP